jgi:LCP family protein required for cell wall assembly
MKKTLFLLCFTLIITCMLFMSGLKLLALVDEIDTVSYGYDGGLDAESGETDGSAPIKIPGFNLPVGEKAMGGLIDVLRDIKTDGGTPINVMLLVSDVGGTNTDAIMVVHYNPSTKQASALSVPRDTYVTVSGLKTHKVNGIFAAKDGANRLKATLESLLGQNIDYYVFLNFKTVREIVDLLGGVDYNVPCDMIYDDPTQDLHINLKKGLRTLTGKQVEGLLRFRKPNKWSDDVKKYYDGSDLKRIERQHDFMNEMLKQKLTLQYIPKIGGVIDNVYSNIKTDLPLAEMLKIARGVTGFSADKFQSATLPGTAKEIDGLSYFVHSENQTQAIVEQFFSDAPAQSAQSAQ